LVTPSEALAASAVGLSFKIKASVIICVTRRGYFPYLISKY